MSKFLNQKCLLELAYRDEHGDPILNDFGEIQYGDPKCIRCRREHLIRDVQTSTGSILKSSTRYFLDSSDEVHAEDKLDSKPIMELTEYVNGLGVTEGYECYV